MSVILRWRRNEVCRLGLALTSMTFAAVASSTGALAQTTIDRGAKKDLLIFGAIGTLLALAWGVAFTGIGLRRIRQGEASQKWPTTPGQIISAEVVHKEGDNDGKYTYFAPEVRYTYVVDDVAYAGEVIKFGLDQQHYFSEDPAKEWVARFPAGSRPPVRYDPANPRTATLEIGQTSGGRFVIAGSFGLILALLGVWYFISTALTPEG